MMGNRLSTALVILAVVLVAAAQPNLAPRVAALEAAVVELQARVAALETTPTPTPPPTPAPTGPPTVAPTSTPAGYTFADEFDGTALGSGWYRPYSCCGTLAGYDPALATVANGVLSIKAERRTNGWYSYLLGTSFTQQYGYFEARIQIPKGKGLWPAFWHTNGGSNYREIDTMEVCANPPNGGNDVTLLHNYVHWPNDGGGAGQGTRTADLSLDYHVYAADWRADHIAFFLDGVEVWRFTDVAHIPAVPLPVIVNLGVGGSWCSAPDATTPSPSEMLVDWIRVGP